VAGRAPDMAETALTLKIFFVNISVTGYYGYYYSTQIGHHTLPVI